MEPMMASTRQTADERRTSVLAAAIAEFARSGYAGTSTEAIAARAGISQPYLFRLFGTKKDLFVATYDLVGDRIINELTRASEGLEGEEALAAMGAAYLELMQDPDLLQVQLHGFAAAPVDPDIARSCRRTFEVLQKVVTERTHLSDDELRGFFAMGMLINVMAAIDLLSIPDEWAQNLCAAPEKTEAIRTATQALQAQKRADGAANEEVPA
jgi:AcrR family transcriptional regulator